MNLQLQPTPTMPRRQRKSSNPTTKPIATLGADDPRRDRPPGRRTDKDAKRLLELLDNLPALPAGDDERRKA